MNRTRYKLLIGAVVVSALLLPQASGAQQAFGNKAGTEIANSGKLVDRVSELYPNEFVIGPEDLLTISVWKEPELSSNVAVRVDGKISIPLVGELQASGRTAEELQKDLTKRLQEYIGSPSVTVIVREVRSRSYNILGEVARPGSYSLAKPTTVVDAIAQAGGLREWARVKSIYILRREPSGATNRIPFDYKKAIRGAGGDFDLRSRDTVVIP